VRLDEHLDHFGTRKATPDEGVFVSGLDMGKNLRGALCVLPKSVSLLLLTSLYNKIQILKLRDLDHFGARKATPDEASFFGQLVNPIVLMSAQSPNQQTNTL